LKNKKNKILARNGRHKKSMDRKNMRLKNLIYEWIICRVKVLL